MSFPATRGERVALGLLLALAGIAFVRVVQRAWTCDDAFISYRYARHLVEGHGLVFNVGERIEGYTNPLFTLGIAGAMALGAKPRVASMVAGAVAYFAVALMLAEGSLERTPSGKQWLPLGAALWLAQDDLWTWATGGLETTVFAALAFAGVRRLSCGDPSSRSYAIGGGWLALACLTRPDGVIFAAVGVLGIFATSQPPARGRRELAMHVAAALVPLAVLGGAFAAAKLWYYGRLLPTTFYAKSAADADYGQGLFYLALYAVKHWSMSVACVVLPIAALTMGGTRTLSGRRDALVALVAFATFSIYVARSGGDFMFARRLVPVLPFLFVFLDAAVSALPARGGAPGAFAFTVASFFPYPVFSGDRPPDIRGISDERSYYPERVIDARRQQGVLARRVFRGIDLKASFGGGMCMFAYYSDLPYMIEPNGLTQYWLAERPLARRSGKIGHEKPVTRDELREHGATLIFQRDLPPLLQAEPRYDEIFLNRTLLVEMLVYDDALMQRLARVPGVVFHSIDDTLRDAAFDLRGMTCGDARASLQSLSRFYLGRHPDRLPPIRDAVAAACSRSHAPAEDVGSP